MQYTDTVYAIYAVCTYNYSGGPWPAAAGGGKATEETFP